MLFGKRKKNAGRDAKPEKHSAKQATAPATTQETDADAIAAIPADRALDMMADLLRILGENAFDVGPRSAEEIEETFETWARHLLIGVPPPSRERDEGEDLEVGPGKRDLPGLRRAVRDQRVAEHDYVTKSLHDFRDAAWSFISSLRRTLTVEQNADRRIGHRMRRLEGAVRSGEPEKIKGEAQETVSLLTEFLAERGTRYREQIQQMDRTQMSQSMLSQSMISLNSSMTTTQRERVME